ncbi:TRAP transporter small permease [Variovorax sp. HJSM1_2]|uniref:TRAP transporter small permease n=1 Tax=Variovorax sp. HJSM1_2 TaxID=3366263 RepID=UPI003BEE8DBF
MKALKLFDSFLAVFASALVVAMLCTVTAGVVTRAIGHPLSWTDEGSCFLMIWLSCLGWMLATRKRAHIRIRFFQDKLPDQAWRWTEAAIQIALAIFGGVIAWYSVHLVHTNADIEALALPLSNAWMYAPLVPAGLLTLCQAVAELWQQWQRVQRPAPIVPAPEPGAQGATP